MSKILRGCSPNELKVFLLKQVITINQKLKGRKVNSNTLVRWESRSLHVRLIAKFEDDETQTFFF